MTENNSNPTKKKPWYRFISSPDAPEVENKDVKVKSIWAGFKDRTTAHGVPHIDKARGGMKVSFWVLVTLVCLGMLAWQTSYVSIYFWDWRVDVLVKLAHQRELTYPAVTVCNMNPIRLSTLANYTDLQTLLQPARRRRSAQGERVKRQTADNYEVEDRVMELLAGYTDEDKFRLGHTVDNMILDCRYAGSNCHISKFSQFFDPSMGNCFVFNSGWDTTQRVESSKRAGRRHGLHMVFNLQQTEYVDELAQGAGVRIVVHPQERMPFPNDEGILASPGQMTSIGIRQVYIKRLGNQYGNCTTTYVRDTLRNVYEQNYPVNYSSNACYKTCYQKYVIERCGCADPQYPTDGEAFGNTVNPICMSDNTDQVECKAGVATDYQNNDLECDCPVMCEETSYNFEVSSVEWPSEVNENVVLNKFSSQIPDILAANDSNEELRRNLLKVEVYFQEFNYETMEERPAYLSANYASDIGGILGLWIGCSVLSIFEFFELFFDIIILGCYRCCSKWSGRRRKPTPALNTALTVREQTSTDTSPGQTPRTASDTRSVRTPRDVTYVEGRRIKKAVPDTPPPPYTSRENLQTPPGGVNRSTKLHGFNVNDPHPLRYV